VTDPIVTVVYFSVALIAFCLVAAVVEGILDRRDRRQAREWNRSMRRRSS
jgi:hypothetical protein